MSADKRSTVDWKPCYPGSLAGFAGQERTRRRRRFLAKAGGVAAVLLLVSGTAFLKWGTAPSGEPNFGGIACTEVRANAMPYMAGQLEADVAERIRVHLEQCPECQRFWQEMSGKTMRQVSLRTPPRSSSDCDCDSCRQRRFLAMSESAPIVATPDALDQRWVASR